MAPYPIRRTWKPARSNRSVIVVLSVICAGSSRHGVSSLAGTPSVELVCRCAAIPRQASFERAVLGCASHHLDRGNHASTSARLRRACVRACPTRLCRRLRRAARVAWRVVDGREDAEPERRGRLRVCLFPAIDACMAVGSRPESGLALAEWWDGQKWSIEHTPQPKHTFDFVGVSCPVVDFCEAVGTGIAHNHGTAFVERWDGLSWQPQPAPTPQDGGSLNGSPAPRPRPASRLGRGTARTPSARSGTVRRGH